MEFDFNDFVLNPTEGKLGKCKKADLLLIASCFNVEVPVGLKKQGLLDLLLGELGRRKLFRKPPSPKPAPAEGVEREAGHRTALHLSTAMTADELTLTLRIQEVEMRKRELEEEARRLKMRALRLEWGAAEASGPVDRSSPLEPPPHKHLM